MKTTHGLLFALALLLAASPGLPAQIVVEATPARRGYLGFSFQREATNRDGARALSLSVTDVVAGSPAEQGGLQAGDIILRLNGISASENLLNSISGSMAPGDTVRLRVRRASGERDLRLIAAEPPAGYFTVTLRSELRPDSVRGMLRLFVDSLEAGLDTTRFRFFSRDGDSARVFVFRDSVMNGDSVIVRRYERRLPGGGVFRFDSTFEGVIMDSVFRVFPFDSTFRMLPNDSAFRHLQVMPGGERSFELSVPGTPGHDRLMVFGVGTSALAGARLETLNPELGRYFRTERGVLVLDVPANTPARRAGLLPGDVITAAGGTSVTDVAGVYRAFGAAKGKAVRLDILRDGQRRSLELTR